MILLSVPTYNCGWNTLRSAGSDRCQVGIVQIGDISVLGKGIMTYQYKMVQVPPTIVVQTGKAPQGPAAAYLESIVSQWAQLGWEFYSIETIGVVEKPGCLASLLGTKSSFDNFYVIVFRQLIGNQAVPQPSVAATTKFCISCGTPGKPGSIFCPECGHKLPPA